MKMSVDLKDNIINYKGDNKMVTELGLNVQNVWDLDTTLNGKFEFLHDRTCGRPRLGYRAKKCRQFNGERYGYIVVK